MNTLTQQLTPQEVYDNYINHPSTNENFMLFYIIADDSSYKFKSHQFNSKDETNCISLLESIMDLEGFAGFPFGGKITSNN